MTQEICCAQSTLDLLQNFEAHGTIFDHIHFGSTWNRIGKNWHRNQIDPEGLVPLRKGTAKMLRRNQTDFRALSNIAHALGKIGFGCAGTWAEMWTVLQESILARLNAGDLAVAPQNYSNTVWAFAKAEHAAPALFDAVAAETALRIELFKPQELGNTVWAFAKAEHTSPGLFEAASSMAVRTVVNFSPQELANTVWAFSKAGHAAPRLFDAVAAEAVRRADAFKPQELMNVVYSFAKAEHAAPVLFDTVASEAQASSFHEFEGAC